MIIKGRERCPTCGSQVKIEGKTTQYYVPSTQNATQDAVCAEREACAEKIDALRAENEKLKEQRIAYLVELISTPLPAFGGQSILEYMHTQRGDCLNYVSATLRRMGFENPLEQENQKLRARIDQWQEIYFFMRCNHGHTDIDSALNCFTCSMMEKMKYLLPSYANDDEVAG